MTSNTEDVKASLRRAEIRRATVKAEWCEAQGKPDRAALYWAMVARLVQEQAKQ